MATGAAVSNECRIPQVADAAVVKSLAVYQVDRAAARCLAVPGTKVERRPKTCRFWEQSDVIHTWL